jgi:Uma2 family endonuclease
MSWLPVSGKWTVDDLALLPDDGLRYELFDGVVVASPLPDVRHQRALGRIFLLLDAACPPDLEVCVAPFGFQPATQRSFQPDVMIVRRKDVRDDASLKKPPLLAVEVLSPSTHSLDTIFKRSLYATSGVDLFWTFDPKRMEFVAYERNGDAYVEVARARDGEAIALDRPYPVEICPARIIQG